MPAARYSRRYKRLFFSVATVFGVVMTGLVLFSVYEAHRGGAATAEVVAVDHGRSTWRPGRT